MFVCEIAFCLFVNLHFVIQSLGRLNDSHVGNAHKSIIYDIFIVKLQIN